MATARKATPAKADEAKDETPVDETPVDETPVDETPDASADGPTVLVDGGEQPIVRDPSEVDPTGKTEREVLAELAGADPVDTNRNSYDAGLAAPVDDTPPAPVDDTPPAAVYVTEPDKAVTTADVAAIQGVQIAPDASLVREVAAGDLPFISEGMRNDLEIHGHAIDPATGRVVKIAE